jgi:DNA polymerase zeta
LPNPERDEVQFTTYAFQSSDWLSGRQYRKGTIAVKGGSSNARRLRGEQIDEVEDELELLNRLIDVVNDLDPDIVAGWELQKASWGYISARAYNYGMSLSFQLVAPYSYVVGLDISELISRAPSKLMGNENDDAWGFRKTSTFKVTGRHVLNVWRIMRSELNLRICTFENVALQLLERR